MSKEEVEEDVAKRVKKRKKSKSKGDDSKLHRLEIIMSQSIEEDFVADFMKEDTGRMFTKLPVVMGRGVTNPKMGDAVWPQLNCMYIIICTKEQAEVTKGIVSRLHQEYPNEGLVCFVSKVRVM